MNPVIKFEFIEHRFDYQLPLLNVDLAFVAARKIEILDCMRQLAEMIPEFNIASKGGVTGFEKANKLVRYYFNALMTVTNKEYLLIHGKRIKTEEEKEAFAVYMYNATGSKTR